jgi:hypothetical protein
MNEAEWLESTNPTEMLDHLRDQRVHVGKAGRRKLRLYGCACCRRIWELLGKKERGWVEWAERIADGAPPLTAEEDEANSGGVSVNAPLARAYLTWAARAPLNRNVMNSAVMAQQCAVHAAELNAARGRDSVNQEVAQGERRGQVALLLDVFGNPFRPSLLPAAVRAWNDGTVGKLAQSLYNERAYDRLGVLADALTDAGCADDVLLSHLRSAGPHVRGCWALDLVREDFGRRRRG